MSKRFTYVKNNSISQYSVLPIQEIGGKTYHCQGVVDKLNKLSNENEQLKSKNRGLQSELQIFKEDVTHSNLQINKLADENEQLKARVDYLERKIQRERKSYQKQHEKWEKELKSE